MQTAKGQKEMREGWVGLGRKEGRVARKLVTLVRYSQDSEGEDCRGFPWIGHMGCPE